MDLTSGLGHNILTFRQLLSLHLPRRGLVVGTLISTDTFNTDATEVHAILQACQQ